MSEQPLSQRTHEAFYAKDIFDQGIGWVIVARFKAGGQRVETGVFCVDVCCLGAKITAFDAWTSERYRTHIINHYFAQFPMETLAPACARKLVEQAVAYAAGLGFAPHREYKKACRVFGGIKAQDCPREFVFGRNGKPFYTRGPSETEAQALNIVQHLQRRCGEGNFDYSVPLGTVAELNRFFGT